MIQLFNEQKTMSSREIAKLTGKRHADVMRDIANTLAQAEIGVSKFAYTYLDSQNKKQNEYLLPKRECDLVVSGYSVKYRLAVIDRWQELEKMQAPALPNFNNPVEAARAWADAKESEQKALIQVQQAQPKIDFVDNYVQSSGNMTFRQVAKLLKIKEPVLRAFLNDRGVMYKLSGHWVPYAQHIDAKRFDVKTGESNGHAYAQAKFTPKGVEWLAGKLAAAKIKGLQ